MSRERNARYNGLELTSSVLNANSKVSGSATSAAEMGERLIFGFQLTFVVFDKLTNIIRHVQDLEPLLLI